ncbi:MAG: hypothetical protein CMM00_02845 [Rhodopirellula sp.]|nr:hypothetical protein [Rhodopirellula sp.]
MSQPTHIKLIFLAVVFCLQTNSVHSAVVETMEFSDIIGVGDSAEFVSSPYTESGFVLTTSVPNPIFTGTEFTARRREVGGVTHDAFSARFPGQITLQKEDGGLFSLLTIDLARATLSLTDPSIPVTFTGTPNVGPLVSQTMTITEAADFETYSFNSSFSNLSSVTWNQVAGPVDHLFDNISVQAAAVPEPTSLAFLGAVLGIASVRRLRCRDFETVVA